MQNSSEEDESKALNRNIDKIATYIGSSEGGEKIMNNNDNNMHAQNPTKEVEEVASKAGDAGETTGGIGALRRIHDFHTAAPAILPFWCILLRLLYYEYSVSAPKAGISPVLLWFLYGPFIGLVIACGEVDWKILSTLSSGLASRRQRLVIHDRMLGVLRLLLLFIPLWFVELRIVILIITCIIFGRGFALHLGFAFAFRRMAHFATYSAIGLAFDTMIRLGTPQTTDLYLRRDVSALIIATFFTIPQLLGRLPSWHLYRSRELTRLPEYSGAVAVLGVAGLKANQASDQAAGLWHYGAGTEPSRIPLLQVFGFALVVCSQSLFCGSGLAWQAYSGATGAEVLIMGLTPMAGIVCAGLLRQYLDHEQGWEVRLYCVLGAALLPVCLGLAAIQTQGFAGTTAAFLASQLSLPIALCFLCLGFQAHPPLLISEADLRVIAERYAKKEANTSEPQFPVPYAIIGFSMSFVHALPLIASINAECWLGVSVATVVGASLLAFFLYVFRRDFLNGAIKAPIRGNARHPIIGLIVGTIFLCISIPQNLLGPGPVIY